MSNIQVSAIADLQETPFSPFAGAGGGRRQHPGAARGRRADGGAGRLRRFLSSTHGLLFSVALVSRAVGYGLWSLWKEPRPAAEAVAQEVGIRAASDVPAVPTPPSEIGAREETAASTDPAPSEPATPLVEVPLPYAVAVASYRPLDEAVERVRALTDAGIAPAYVVPVRVDDGVFYRVYAGALPGRAEAEALLDRLVREGLKDGLTAWDIRPAGQAFDFGTFETEAEARSLIDRLLEDGIVAYALPVPAPDADGTLHYRVYAGAYPNAGQATELAAVIQRQGLEAVLTSRSGLNASATRSGR